MKREMDIPNFMMRGTQAQAGVDLAGGGDTTVDVESLYPKNLLIEEENIIQPELSKAEKDKYINMIKGMSQEELELVVDTIPVKMCLNRIIKELNKYDQFAGTVRNAFDILG